MARTSATPRAGNLVPHDHPRSQPGRVVPMHSSNLSTQRLLPVLHYHMNAWMPIREWPVKSATQPSNSKHNKQEESGSPVLARTNARTSCHERSEIHFGSSAFQPHLWVPTKGNSPALIISSHSPVPLHRVTKSAEIALWQRKWRSAEQRNCVAVLLDATNTTTTTTLGVSWPAHALRY